jgi:hypothetical protein
MMSILNSTTAAIVSTLAVVFALPAQGALTVRLTNSAGTVTCTDGTGTDASALSGTVACITSDAAFSVDITTAISNAPGGPATLQKTVNLVSSTGSVATPNDLLIEVSDTGFLLPSGMATLTETVNTNTPIGPTSATGTVTGAGFLSNGPGGGVLFDTTGVTTGDAFVNTFSVGGAATSAVTTNFVTAFGLTNVLEVSATSAGFATFTSTLSAAVPEPTSVALFGTVFLLTGFGLRRKFAR